MGTHGSLDTNVDELTALKFRIEGTREAQRRSRIAFLVSTIVSLSIIVVCWNAYGSWYRAFALKKTFSTNEVVRYNQEALLQEWIKTRGIDIPLLGIRAGASDVGLLGSISLLVISLWFFYSMRRENHTIALLLIETKDKCKEIREVVYHGIIDYLVFTSLTKHDDPISDLYGSPRRQRRVPFVRPALRILIYLPVISLSCVILFDLLTIKYIDSPFRDPPTTLAGQVAPSKSSGSTIEASHEPGETTKAAVIIGFALVLTTMVGSLCSRIVKYEVATARIPKTYQKHGVDLCVAEEKSK